MHSRSGIISADLHHFEGVNVSCHEALHLARWGGPWRRCHRVDALVDGVVIGDAIAIEVIGGGIVGGDVCADDAEINVVVGGD